MGVSVRRQGAIATVTLADGAMNLFTFATVQALREACLPLLEAADVRVIVLASGLAHVWSAGADLAEFADPEAHAAAIAGWYFDTFDLAGRFLQSDKLVVAALSRSVVGVAAALVLACDFRWLSTRANFYLPEARLGLVAPLFSADLLQATVGLERAKEILLACPKIGPEEARAAGLASRVFGYEGFGEEVERAAIELAGRSGTAVSIIKRQLFGRLNWPELGANRESFIAGTDSRTPPHWADFMRALESPEAREGIRAHLAAHPGKR